MEFNEMNEQQPQTPETQDSGYYHGLGAGQRESLFSDYSYVSYQTEHTDVPPQQPQPQRRERKKSGVGKKIFKGIGLVVLAVILVVTSCGLTAVLSGWYWNSRWSAQYSAMQQNLNEKADALQAQIDRLEKQPAENGGTLTPEADTLTAGQIYQQNVNSVVALTCTVVTSSNGASYSATSAGTGFILSENGYIVTNHHVVDGATAIVVTMEDGTEYTGRLIGSDATNDVALVKINAIGLKAVTIGSSASLQVGDQVVAIGNALGELSSSLTVGYISGTDRNVTTDGSVINMLQTDVAINSGNSGGPLFNAKGEVIGITTAKYSGTTSSGASIEGISFAIPIDDVLDILEDLQQYGYVRSAYLGIYATDVDQAAAEYYGFPVGVYVASAEPGYCAYAAGIQAKDIIVELAGYEVTCMNDLSRVLRQLEAGDTVTVVVWRSGQEVILTVTLDERPQS